MWLSPDQGGFNKGASRRILWIAGGSVVLLAVLVGTLVFGRKIGPAPGPAGDVTLTVEQGTVRLYHFERNLFGQEHKEEVVVGPGEGVGVWPDESIITGGGTARLALADDVTVTVAPGSALRFVALDVSPPRYLVRLHLTSGELAARVGDLPPGSRFEVTTPSTAVTANDAAFTVEVVDTRQTRVAAEQGEVAVQTGANQTTLADGEMLLAAAGRPFEVEALPEPVDTGGEEQPVSTGGPSQDTHTGPAPTPTDAPTAGESPAATESGLRAAGGAPVLIPRCTTPPTVDGMLDEAAYTAGFPIEAIVFGTDEWAGLTDLSGQMWLCWTDAALHVGVEVFDDVHVQTSAGDDIWLGDEVEIVFDADLQGDYDQSAQDGDDVHLGFSPGDFADLPPAAIRHAPASSPPGDAFEVAARPGEGTGYTLEAAVSWPVLAATPGAGSDFGFCLAISDNDQPGQASQDSMVSHCPGLSTTDPTTWALLTLSG